MAVYGFFSLFAITMMVALLFLLIFLRNRKLAVYLGIGIFVITVVQFVLLNMTKIHNEEKSIVILITLILYFSIVIFQLYELCKREGMIKEEKCLD